MRVADVERHLVRVEAGPQQLYQLGVDLDHIDVINQVAWCAVDGHPEPEAIDEDRPLSCGLPAEASFLGGASGACKTACPRG